MDVNEVIDRARDAFNVRRVFGEPIQQGEVTVIPAAWVSGGGGGGGGEGSAPEGAEAAGGTGKGFGSGFGLRARPAGAFGPVGGQTAVVAAAAFDDVDAVADQPEPPVRPRRWGTV